jgi:hypothetical protein
MAEVEGFVSRPALAFRVGITGARTLESAALPALRTKLDAILAQLRARLELAAAQTATAAIYAPGPPLLRMISPLAEGADRLAAAQALALGYQLEAPLPFSAAEYEKDFPASVTDFRALLAAAGPRVLELDGARGTAENASYEAVGRLVARNCDLLIAIWDGGPSKGRGGTGDIVQYALRHDQPVWWLRADGSGEPAWLETRHALHQDAMRPAGEAAFAKLEAYLLRGLLPAPEAHEHGHGALGEILRHFRPKPAASPLAVLLAEQPLRQHAIWSVHKWLMNLTGGNPPAAGNAAKPPAPSSQVWTYWQAFYEPLDHAAISYGERYRSSYILVFLLAALAVSCAVVGVGFHNEAPLAPSLEFVLLLGILAIVLANEFLRWHPKLITYRLLAELFRKQQALALLAWSLPAAKAAEVSGGDEDSGAAVPRDALVGWYFNAALRAAPLPQGQLASTELSLTYKAVTDSLVTGQSDYHGRRRQMAETSARRFGQLSAVLFLTALGIVFLEFLFTWGRYFWSPGRLGEAASWGLTAAGFVAALLPSLSAAFVGIRSYSELELLADQSLQMQRLTSQAAERLRKLPLDTPLASQELGAEMLLLAEEMLLDIKGWAQLFRVKAVEAG